MNLNLSSFPCAYSHYSGFLVSSCRRCDYEGCPEVSVAFFVCSDLAMLVDQWSRRRAPRTALLAYLAVASHHAASHLISVAFPRKAVLTYCCSMCHLNTLRSCNFSYHWYLESFQYRPGVYAFVCTHPRHPMYQDLWLWTYYALQAPSLSMSATNSW